MSAPVIFVYNLKGGVAKTTTVVNLAAVLGKMSKRVLVIDIDPQSAATWMLGISSQKIEQSMYAAIMGVKPIVDVIQRTKFENVDVAPASEDLYGLDADIEEIAHEREQLLHKALLPVTKIYDMILIDSHNKYGLTELNALYAADFLLVPVSCGVLPFWGLNQLERLLYRAASRYNHQTRILGYLLTMYHKKIISLHSQSKDIEKQLRARYGALVFNTVIEYDENIDKATAHQEPITYYQRHTKGSKEFEQLALEVIHRISKLPYSIRGRINNYTATPVAEVTENV